MGNVPLPQIKGIYGGEHDNGSKIRLAICKQKPKNLQYTLKAQRYWQIYMRERLKSRLD